MLLATPLPHQNSSGLQIASALIEFGCKRADVRRQFWPVQQAQRLWFQVAETVGLKPVRQNSEEQMAGNTKGRLPSKDCLPSSFQASDIEIAQSSDLDV